MQSGDQSILVIHSLYSRNQEEKEKYNVNREKKESRNTNKASVLRFYLSKTSRIQRQGI